MAKKKVAPKSADASQSATNEADNELRHLRETTVLGAAIWDADVAEAVASMPVEVFWEERHRLVASAIASAWRAETWTNGEVLPLIEAAQAAGTLAQIGGGATFMRLSADAPVCAFAVVEPYIAALRADLTRRVTVQAHERAARAIADGADPAAELARAASVVALTDPLVSSHLPAGYSIGPDGDLWRDERATGEGTTAPPLRISPCRIDITRRSEDAATGVRVTEISWHLDGRRHTHTVPREALSVARSLSALSAIGLPVTSESARYLVAYFAAAEEATGVPLSYGARQCGWHKRSFLRGRHRHVAPGTPITDCPEWIPGTGSDALIDAVRQEGSSDTWRAMAAELCAFPIVRLTLLCALAAPLLPVLGAPTWCLDLGSESSKGKTSALRCALSIWGDPSRLMLTWDATRVGIITAASALSGFPLGVDDTQRAEKRDECWRLAYDIVAGAERLRGMPSAGGGGAALRPVTRFDSLLLSTGEGPLVALSAGAAGGARARTLHIGAMPWGGDSPEYAERIRGYVSTATQHYGHAGAAFIDRLVALTDDDRAELRARYQQHVATFARSIAALCPSAPAADRVAQYLAAIETCGEIAVEIDLLPAPKTRHVDNVLITEIASRMSEIDRARAALEAAHTWLASNPARVVGLEARTSQGDIMVPAAGYIGMMSRSAGAAKTAMIPAALHTELAKLGYNPDAVISTWHRRGWLVAEEGARTRKITIAGERLRAYVLSPAAVELLAGAPEADDRTFDNADDFA